jgi:UDP-N-acetylglucosamine 2-epimerase (non-hydrolysing)
LKIISVVGARPNFMKVAPIHKAFNLLIAKDKSLVNQDLKFKKIEHLICHTGQHYDEKMSKVFFEDLELPQPDFYLGIGSCSHAEQTAKIMVEFEKVLKDEEPELIIVVGDVNSTVACSLVASKMGIKIAHVEAGLRSFDRSMPEEINRVLTDHLADYLFVTESSGIENLKHEGIDENKIFFTGNVMIDSLVHYLPKAKKSNVNSRFGIQKSNYILVTLHRPSNVDSLENVRQILILLNNLAEKRKIIFPVHPRTRNNIDKLNLRLNQDLILTEPIGYIDFIALTNDAELIITDSGGIQEESTFLGIQWITVRDNTERPVTVELGTNQLTGTDMHKVEETANEILNGNIKKGIIPELWDGHASERIAEIILKLV